MTILSSGHGSSGRLLDRHAGGRTDWRDYGILFAVSHRLGEDHGQDPAEFRDKVEVEARTCLELCEKENLGGAPYVRFNGEEIMAQATNEKVLARIEELVGGAA